ncbi:Glutamate receptor ionotropic, NMDA 2B [Frankliniella fusca]|uniref:Glutamate receptor ionotropic, NMDA 2B n=1 Tax=Frankliniella fusca TaxID=407009 RepID=A0AAE1H5Z2_9NEOP|nr:Glutamate receptor ionotropic, NMDA 2B [Frankliniella fusca]
MTSPRDGMSHPALLPIIGAWKSWEGAGLGAGLDVRDIVWPGMSHTPPQGVPEKFHLRIAFLEEPPYVNLEPLDPVTNKCPMNRGVHCRVGREDNPSARRCCSGFCIDLLHKFAEDLGFTFDLFRVEDGKWGAQTNGRWNGLVAALMNHNAELVMTSLKINYERSQAIDFSLPFLDTGIAIVVAKRTGIISPTAFLEPFDSDMWMLVALGAVHIAAIAIFVFEWVTPAGYDRELGGPREHRVSLCRTLWLVWAVLFQAAVNVDCPRGYTARCMANVWAMFALIFLAIYTANLAAFMITREEFHELSGINDTKLNNPYSLKPPFRFGTIPHGNTDAVLRRNFPQMHGYMRQYNRSSVADGVRAVKDGSLDAFLYDATVLDYLAGQDADCVLVTVGSWFAMTGYGVGFPRHSKYRPLINRLLMEYRENGDLERLRRYWFTGSCNNPAGKEKQSRSDPLALEQFFSTFLLLLLGMAFSGVLLLGENVYLKYALKRQRRLGLDGRGSPHHQLPHQVHPEDRRSALRAQIVDLNRRHALPAPPPPPSGPGPGPGLPPPSRMGMYMASCCALFSTSLGRSLMGDPPRMAPARRLLAGPRGPGRGPRSRMGALHVQLQPHDAERCAAAHKHLQAALADARARADKLERLLRAAQPQRGGGLAGVVQSVVPQLRAFSTASVATVCSSRASVVHGPRWSPDGSPVRLPVSRRCAGVGGVPAPPAGQPRPGPGSGSTTPHHHLNSAAAYALRHEAVGAPTPPEFETVL